MGAFNETRPGGVPTRKIQWQAPGTLVGVVDVGTTKVCALIGRAGAPGSIELLGLGHQVARGLRGGQVIDLDAATNAIGTAIEAAELRSGETVRSLVVNLSGPLVRSYALGIELDVPGGEVKDALVKKALSTARAKEPQIAESSNFRIIHTIPVSYGLDGQQGIRDPRGMHGNRLTAHFHVVTAQAAALKTIASAIGHWHLEVSAWCAAPIAAGLSSLVDDEMEMGVTLIDMGGGTTSIAVFKDGVPLYVDAVPLGGANITSDIAHGLTTSLAHAERIKTLYGAASGADLVSREAIDVPLVGEDDLSHIQQVDASLLAGIIQPRVEETLELVRRRLEAHGFDQIAGRRVVLTGGASQLPGMRELAARILGNNKQVRLGRPIKVAGLTETSGGPDFAVAAGLLVHGAQLRDDFALPDMAQAPRRGIWTRFSGWLNENL